MELINYLGHILVQTRWTLKSNPEIVIESGYLSPGGMVFNYPPDMELDTYHEKLKGGSQRFKVSDFDVKVIKTKRKQ